MRWWAMSMARVVITAVVLEGRSKSEVAREYGVSRGWCVGRRAGRRSAHRQVDADVEYGGENV